jgi:hypothetical protein
MDHPFRVQIRSVTMAAERAFRALRRIERPLRLKD